MIIQAYSMDQIAGVVNDTIDDIPHPHNSPRKLWPNHASTTRYSADKLITSHGSIDSYVIRDSKLAYYLNEAYRRGCLDRVFDHPEPIACTVKVYDNCLILDDNWFAADIYDVGALSMLFQSKSDDVQIKHLPHDLQFMYKMANHQMQGMKRDFEVSLYWWRKDCKEALDTNEIVKDALGRIRSY